MKLRDPSPLLSDLAYERILQALFEARVAMGARVSQTDLVALTGVPLGPVRDALKVLETDGIVTVHPRSGIEVIKPTTDLVRATFQFRTIIERQAARMFAQTAPEAELRRLIALHEECAAEFATLDPNTNVADRLTGIEHAFHQAVVAALGNELVDASYRRLQLMARVIRVKGTVFPRAARVSLDEHREVLTACLARDADGAEQAMVRHLSNALNRNLGVA
jgi:DNA-binding GntR family transcriptional regulator